MDLEYLDTAKRDTELKSLLEKALLQFIVIRNDANPSYDGITSFSFKNDGNFEIYEVPSYDRSSTYDGKSSYDEVPS